MHAAQGLRVGRAAMRPVGHGVSAPQRRDVATPRERPELASTASGGIVTSSARRISTVAVPVCGTAPQKIKVQIRTPRRRTLMWHGIGGLGRKSGRVRLRQAGGQRLLATCTAAC